MDGPDAGKRNFDQPDSRNEDPRPGVTIADDENETRSDTTSRYGRSDAVRIEDGIGRWLLETDDRMVAVSRNIAMAFVGVAVASLLLFAISGQFPVLVAVESGSMSPNMQTGDLVFIVEEDRFADGAAIDGTGVVTLDRGQESEYQKFNNPGDVIIFRPNGDPTATPVIHRAHFWVEDGENWVQTAADPGLMNGATCTDIPSCPASHDGFVTKGDANEAYDQVPHSGAETTVVSPHWVTGKAMTRVPWIGQIRLTIDSIRMATGFGSIAIVGASSILALVLFVVAAGTDTGRS
ncbi:S26 family signal peptidase [Natrinema halophilum]|uniref:S26 family signal peptidase n=1 Tax=Natrinema halophilum TaxID=1699371 RepID=A0A7D5KE02_9EURY|nr:S26 family signal peptidase [Natrinema halophilum]QLG49776.1 S26 family signal peptidase [Natrinema halophilum]